MKIFNELVKKYNEELRKLTKTYGVTFIDLEKFNLSTGNKNFHINSKGHIKLENQILNQKYENKLNISSLKKERLTQKLEEQKREHDILIKIKLDNN